MHAKLLIYLGLLIVGFLFPCLINAQEEPTSLGLSVDPQIFELDFFPGETHGRKITVKNLSEVAMPIAVRVTDFTAAEDSGDMLFDEALEDPSIASKKWFEIENPNFILDPEEKEKLSFIIKVPENAEPGGHYSVMLFEPQLPSFYFKPGQPKVVPVVGVLFLLSVKTFSLEPEIQQKLEVVEFFVPKEERLLALEDFVSKLAGSVAQAATEITITEKSPQNFILKIKNNDIYHIKPYGKVLIYNLFGKKVAEAEIPQRTILPGKIRQFPVGFSLEIPQYLKWLPASVSYFLVQNFFVGRYQAKLDLEIKSPLAAEIIKPNITNIVTFFSLPWKFWIIFLIILGILMLFGIRHRKRIKAALSVLVKRNPTEI